MRAAGDTIALVTTPNAENFRTIWLKPDDPAIVQIIDQTRLPGEVVFRDAPRQIFQDACVRVATIVFFGLFSLSMFIGANEDLFPGFAERVVGSAQLEQMESMYEQPLQGSLEHYVTMAGFYIQHNSFR